MRISDWSSDVCSSDLYADSRATGTHLGARFACADVAIASGGFEVMSKFISALLGVSLLAVAATAQAEGRVMSNDLSQCRNGPSTLVQINGVKASTGKIRVQSYRGTAADWLEKGRWLARIEEIGRAHV